MVDFDALKGIPHLYSVMHWGLLEKEPDSHKRNLRQYQLTNENIQKFFFK